MTNLLWIFYVFLIFEISSVQLQETTTKHKNNKNKVDNSHGNPSIIQQTPSEKPLLRNMWSLLSQDPISTERQKPKVETRRKTNELCKLCQFMYDEADVDYLETFNTKRFCVHLLQVKNCMTELRQERIRCNFILSMLLKGAVKVRWDKNNCEQYNVTANDLVNVLKSERQPEPDIGLNCRYRPPSKKNDLAVSGKNLSNSNHMHCGMFGDPHVKTFYDVRQTCVVAGEWSLLDNEYMSVNVTNEIVQNTQMTSATATTKVKNIFIIFFLTN